MSKSTVFANGQGISSKNSEAVSTADNDVCLTPAGAIVIPVSYTNIAKSVDIAKGTMTVKTDGGMAAIEGCCYAKSTGDEPGVALGVGSGTVGDKAEFINYSNDVFYEGRPVCRNSDSMHHNNKNTIGTNQDSAAAPPVKEIDEINLDPGTIRYKIVEHLCWDNHNEERGTFLLGHSDNKAITDKTFIITLPDGSKVEKTPDAEGIIEITGLEQGGKCSITFKPEETDLNSSYHLHYERVSPIKPK